MFIVLAALPGACLEMPVTRELKIKNRVGAGDAGTDAATDPQAACLACMQAPEDPGPGCAIPFQVCFQDDRCAPLVQCAIDAQCLQGSRRLFVSCSVPCLTKGGVQTPDEYVLTIATNLFQCIANGPCGNICFTEE